MGQSEKNGAPRRRFHTSQLPSGMREMWLAMPAMMAMPMPPSFMAMPAVMMGAIIAMVMLMPAVMVMITRLGIGSR